jgi:hypothetical protein
MDIAVSAVKSAVSRRAVTGNLQLIIHVLGTSATGAS